MLRKDYKENEYLINTHDSLIKAKNDPYHVDERRYVSRLRLTAGGTLVMGIWSLLRSFMGMFGDLGKEMQEEGISLMLTAFGAAIVFAIAFVIAISLRYIVWSGASKETRDGKKRNGYILCAVILMAYGVFSIFSFIRKVISRDVEGHDITTTILDLTSFIILCELLHSVFMLRKVRRETSEVL